MGLFALEALDKAAVVGNVRYIGVDGFFRSRSLGHEPNLLSHYAEFRGRPNAAPRFGDFFTMQRQIAVPEGRIDNRRVGLVVEDREQDGLYHVALPLRRAFMGAVELRIETVEVDLERAGESTYRPNTLAVAQAIANLGVLPINQPEGTQ
ncbi:hypothetical protein KDA23_01865 [Candidatus Saccharibacteria bacterium]|nr:hypothetical protein [Candidatus Saccharibacteria bacterium]